MSDRRATTVKLTDKGNSEYARVPERLKLFRSDCPRGSIETVPTFQEDGGVMFMATVVKDQKDPDSARATGHSLGGKKGVKNFEKLETVAVGRALAMLGYLASGEIASTEEMDEFNAFRDEQHALAIQSAIEAMDSARTVEELKLAFMESNLMFDEAVIAAKDKRKAELTPSGTGAKKEAK